MKYLVLFFYQVHLFANHYIDASRWRPSLNNNDLISEQQLMQSSLSPQYQQGAYTEDDQPYIANYYSALMLQLGQPNPGCTQNCNYPIIGALCLVETEVFAPNYLNDVSRIRLNYDHPLVNEQPQTAILPTRTPGMLRIRHLTRRFAHHQFPSNANLPMMSLHGCHQAKLQLEIEGPVGFVLVDEIQLDLVRSEQHYFSENPFRKRVWPNQNQPQWGLPHFSQSLSRKPQVRAAQTYFDEHLQKCIADITLNGVFRDIQLELSPFTGEFSPFTMGIPSYTATGQVSEIVGVRYLSPSVQQVRLSYEATEIATQQPHCSLGRLTGSYYNIYTQSRQELPPREWVARNYLEH